MRKRFFRGIVAAFLCSAVFTYSAHATDPKSTNYQFDESSIATGGLYDASSSSYQAMSSTTDIAVGATDSSNYQVVAGTKTPHDPTLSFSVNTTSGQFGQFAPNQTSTAAATFSVSNYTTYGYVVQITGSPPSTGQYALKAMNVAGPSQVGIEQFGINLVANTSPISFGANPDNGSFGYGSVTANYSTPNTYYYQDGDIIARADKDSGVTNYTISFIVNVSPLTAGGQYTSNQTLVVTGTY